MDEPMTSFGQGDVWNKSYSKTHPWLSSCELCGVSPTQDEHGSSYGRARRGEWYAASTKSDVGRFVIMTWDHCHAHNIVRGTLCDKCNIEEESDRHTHHWGERFTKWRARCLLCVETDQFDQHDREGCSVCASYDAARRDRIGRSATKLDQGSSARPDSSARPGRTSRSVPR